MAGHKLIFYKGKAQIIARQRVRPSVAQTVRQVKNRSQVLVPVDTGYLRASAKTSIRSNGSAVIGTVVYTADYAAAVHNGRRALTIRPKDPNGYLWFKVNGKRVRAKEVHQKARAGRPYLTDALREVAPGNGFRVTIG